VRGNTPSGKSIGGFLAGMSPSWRYPPPPMSHVLPLIAIVGRPNVGKSSLFNRLIGKPVSIVDDVPGVTRDRILHEVRRDGYRFDLVDTGGIGLVDEHKLELDVERQIFRAVDTADQIIFLCDGRGGRHPQDEVIAAKLRPHAERVVVAVNKIDHENLEPEIHAFNKLGLGEPLPVSAEQIRGFGDLLDRLAERLPDLVDPDPGQTQQPRADAPISLCFVGRRNVGKSSLTNALVGEDRVIVADHAGTTRDAIDVPLHHNEHGDFLLIDTAGLRRKKQLKQDLEFYAAVRAEHAIGRADVAVLVVDCTDEIGQVDKKLAHYCEASGRPTILLVNKWDLAQGSATTQAAFTEFLRARLPGLRFAPVLYASALNGRNIDRLLPQVLEVARQQQQRVDTAELNQLLAAAVRRRRPRKVGPAHTKIYYATQADSAPPTFIIFVNRTDWIEPGYSRYLENFFRRHLPFGDVPYRIVFKARSSQFHEHADERVRMRAGTKAERNPRLLLPKASKRQRDERSGQRRKRKK
jgi:GTPase